MSEVRPLPVDEILPAARLDPLVFIPSVAITLFAGIFLVTRPDVAEGYASIGMSWVTGQFGWLFVIAAALAFIFVLWLAFGRFGRVKLGLPDEAPEYSELSWAAMMFSAGIGIGLVSWAFVEPLHHVSGPPMGIAPGSSMSAEWGHMYALFHWGLVPWALYALPTVPIAYALYVRETPSLRISVATAGAMSTTWQRRTGPLIDTLVIIGMIGGAGTSIGLGVPLVSAFTGELFGIEDGFGLQMGVLAFWTLIFGTSVYRGLKAGIRWLADANIWLAIIVVLFILVTGPTVFILTLTANSLGLMLDNLIRLSFWLDPIDMTSFPRDWTVFYWAWWFGYAPLMGLFFGRISRGRTIRQVVFGVIGWGCLGCLSFMAVCGAYALHLEVNHIVPVAQIIKEQGNPAAVVAIVNTLPMARVALIVLMLLSFIFLATTLDSVAYVLASISTKDLPGDEEPNKYNRLLWAFALAFIAVGLLTIGGLATVQSSSVITALPLVPVFGLLALSLVRWLNQDFGVHLNPPVLALQLNQDGTSEVIEEAVPPPPQSLELR